MTLRVLFRRPDPHHVYDWLLQGRLTSGPFKRVRRGFTDYSSDFWLIRVLLIVLGDMCTAFLLCRHSGQKIFVSEFNAITALVLFFPVSFVFDLTDVHLNLNHNLLNSRETPALATLARRLKVCFIEASPSLIARYPFVTNLAIARPIKNRAVVKDVYAFSGNRHEQFLKEVGIYRDELCQEASRNNLNLEIVGALSGRRLRLSEYYDVFSEGVLVVLLYSTENYEVRHSGIALHALAAGCPILAHKSQLIDHYIDRGFAVHAFDSIDSFSRELGNIFVDFQ
jgi:hypothetical protein